MAIKSTLCKPLEEEKKYHLIVFASRQFSIAAKNYTTTKQEHLAMVFLIKKFRHYLLMNPIVFFVDHLAINYLINKSNLDRRLAYYILLLSKFDYTIQYKLGQKHLEANYLSCLFSNFNPKNLNDEFFNSKLFYSKAIFI